jgi:nucleotide-binding universal stress UspA family protein
MAVITVGVDGSSGGDAALAWAHEEALLRGAGLRLVHAYQLPPMLPGALAPPSDDLEEVGNREVDEALSRCGLTGDVPIERDLVYVAQGNAARALIEASKDADLLVVGSRGLGGFMGLLVGSVSQQCVSHAHCPVVVIPHPHE